MKTAEHFRKPEKGGKKMLALFIQFVLYSILTIKTVSQAR